MGTIPRWEYQGKDDITQATVTNTNRPALHFEKRYGGKVCNSSSSAPLLPPPPPAPPPTLTRTLSFAYSSLYLSFLPILFFLVHPLLSYMLSVDEVKPPLVFFFPLFFKFLKFFFPTSSSLLVLNIYLFGVHPKFVMPLLKAFHPLKPWRARTQALAMSRWWCASALSLRLSWLMAVWWSQTVTPLGRQSLLMWVFSVYQVYLHCACVKEKKWSILANIRKKGVLGVSIEKSNRLWCYFNLATPPPSPPPAHLSLPISPFSPIPRLPTENANKHDEFILSKSHLYLQQRAWQHSCRALPEQIQGRRHGRRWRLLCAGPKMKKINSIHEWTSQCISLRSRTKWKQRKH